MIRSEKINRLKVEQPHRDLSLDQLIASIDQLNQTLSELQAARSERSPTSMVLAFGTFSPKKEFPKLKFSEFEPSLEVKEKKDEHSSHSKIFKNPCASPINEKNVHLLSPKKPTMGSVRNSV